MFQQYRRTKSHECPPDGTTTTTGRCAGFCPECGEHFRTDGRYQIINCCAPVNEEVEDGEAN